MERTLSIIKPDAVDKNIIGKIIDRLEEANLNIVAARMLHLSKEEARKFYDVHVGKPFYDELVEYMTSGPVMVMVLEGNNAVAQNRKVMGATDPKKADKGTIRAEFGESIDRNVVHGSDAPETAKREIAFFFTSDNIHTR